MNPKAMISIYGEFPSLSGSELSDVHVKRDEPRLSVKLITEEKPKSCPDRWPKNYDVVHIKLSFVGLSCLSFSHWGHENIIDKFEWEDMEESVSVRFVCKNQTTLAFSCDWIRIESITYGHVGSP
ncbi:Hypothetical protein H16_B2106 [Cupriavidus necator H16]|nr:Hypothetical protein H16_B2106 [Cupriavidus necator H16]